MKTQQVSHQNSTKLPLSLNLIVRELSLHQKLTPSKVIKVLQEANVQPEDLLPWAEFGHPVEDSYGRKLVYKGDNFEVMVMSWLPGDFSTIHDHGHTQWGAVQIFGPAEHATFRWEEDRLITLSRMEVTPFTVVGVSHSLIHQMGNPTTDTSFLSLHVYGDVQPVDSVTGDARIFNLENDTIERVDGGVFFELPEDRIKSFEEGPRGDFPTWIRNRVERIRRLRNIGKNDPESDHTYIHKIEQSLFSPKRHSQLIGELEEILNTKSQVTNTIYWRILRKELKEAALIQNLIENENRNEDSFQNYAYIYDELIGKPCLNSFMKGYLSYAVNTYNIDLKQAHIISLGCGTGLVEEYMIKELGIPSENMLGIDLSAAMVDVAKQRIHAEQGDILTMKVPEKKWDIAYSGLNVLHYLNPEDLGDAITKIAEMIQPGGYFIGDFITPDHVRWYPNVVFSEDNMIVSLRNPKLIEEEGRMFQESEITNINFHDDQMRITYSGKHKRFLPAMNRVRTYFELAFGGNTDLYDAVTLKPIPEYADSCSSTRYIVVARRG